MSFHQLNAKTSENETISSSRELEERGFRGKMCCLVKEGELDFKCKTAKISWVRKDHVQNLKKGNTTSL